MDSTIPYIGGIVSKNVNILTNPQNSLNSIHKIVPKSNNMEQFDKIRLLHYLISSTP